MNCIDDDIIMLFIMLIVFFWIVYEINNSLYVYRLFIQMLEEYFDLKIFDDEFVKRIMRFIKFQIRLLIEYFDIVFIEWINRLKSILEIVMCLLLFRLSYSERLFILIRIFYRSEKWLSSIYNDVIEHLIVRYRNILHWHFMFNDYKHLRRYDKVVKKKLNIENSDIIDFIDDIFRDVCRSVKKQQQIYSNYKKHHDIRWQNIMFSNDIIDSLIDSYEKKINDWIIWQINDVEQRLKNISRNQIRSIYLYENSIYRAIFDVIESFRDRATLSFEKHEFNKSMILVRIVVKQNFDFTQKQWSHHDWSLFMKMNLQFVTTYYLMKVLLTNCFICLKNNQINEQFLIESSTLKNYLFADMFFS